MEGKVFTDDQGLLIRDLPRQRGRKSIVRVLSTLSTSAPLNDEWIHVV